MRKFSFAFFFVSTIYVTSVIGLHQGLEYAKDFTNQFVVRIKRGSKVAEEVASDFKLILQGRMRGFEDTFLLKKSDPSHRNRREPQLTENLLKDDRVDWAEQLFKKRRQKRDIIPSDKARNFFHKLPKRNHFFKNKADKYFWDEEATDSKDENDSINDLMEDDDTFNDLTDDDDTFNDLSDDEFVHKQLKFNDELWDQQWYLHNNRTSKSKKLDLNVLPCFDLGITGKGIRIAVVDDGLEWTHEDLIENYDPEISYDAVDHDPDPMPRYDKNSHGTNCAGVIAMKANNGKCGVGVAINAKVGGIRLLDKAPFFEKNEETGVFEWDEGAGVVDWNEATALGYAYDKIDIYSCSWGPSDDGQTVESFGELVTEAIERGIKKGRNGKGAIFVVSGGNGGRNDDCNCDGYANSIYTIAVGAATKQGRFIPYGEKCASTLTSTFSGGTDEVRMIVTTEIGNKCTTGFSGTSAATPLASGIIALALEANPDLTWRDIQHLIVWTSEYEPLSENKGWIENAAGYWVNPKFGFGLMNAFAMVTAAKNWTTVPQNYTCSFPSSQKNIKLVYGKDVKMRINARSCKEINYLEHVELQINIDYTVRGNLEIHLISPLGTEITLLRRRRYDLSENGFQDWKLMSVLTWNENPQGIWRVLIKDSSQWDSSEESLELKGEVGEFTLHLYGTKDMPAYLKNGPRQYNLDDNISEEW